MGGTAGVAAVEEVAVAEEVEAAAADAVGIGAAEGAAIASSTAGISDVSAVVVSWCHTCSFYRVFQCDRRILGLDRKSG